MELTEINNINVYGKHYHKISYDEKFEIIKELYGFARGDIKNSWRRNELYLIPDSNKAVYMSAGGSYIVCDAEKDGDEYICHNIITLKEYAENTDNIAAIDQFKKKINMSAYVDAVKEKEKYYKNNCDNYYEIKFNRDKTGHIYLENMNGREFIDIHSNCHGIEIEFNDIKLGNIDDYDWQNKSILESILEYIMLNRDLFKDFRKLKNGYIWNNEYYEDYNEIFYDIKRKIDEKNLKKKFMTEGLTLDDFSDKKIEK